MNNRKEIVMAAVNKVIIIGNLGRDPELKRTPSGAAVCTISVATTEKSKDQAGNQKEHTEWHDVVFWNKSAEAAAQYLKKGSSVYIEGKLRTRSWEDNGQKRYRTEIVVSSFQFLDRKEGGQQGGFQQQQQQYQQPQNQQYNQQQQYQQPQQQSMNYQQQQQPNHTAGFQPIDDDLPF